MSAVEVQQPSNHLHRFGLASFRPGQEDVIRAVLDGQDCLCIMPTGGGKSLCFQLPGIMRPGVVLVISPLIALMKDQVDSLQRQGLRATCINSSLDMSEQRQRLADMAAGQFDLVYIAPERLRSAKFLETLKHVPVQLLAIDEAHCISEWGHDFRPDYTRIGRFRETIGWPQTIALTATATADVRRDVIEQLQLRSPSVFITGFARPNLRFECCEPNSTLEKNERLVDLIRDTDGAVLIYAATRKRCEELVEYLGENLDRPAGLYHAGLMPDDRRRVQDEFMSGRLPVIVATNAFGMGIDKRDLRLVVHYNLPGTIEAYYQEAGRAGRDGKPARCVLLFSFSDRYVQEFFIENRYPAKEIVKQVYEFLRRRPEDPIELTLQQIKESLNLSITSEGVGTCEQLLEKCGAIERLDSQQNQASVKIEGDLPTIIDMIPREAKIQRKVLRAIEKLIDDQRGEWVFFSLQRLAASLELDREALHRAIRELQRLEPFEYVAPFRGRAIRLLRRNTPFEKLQIDFAEMARRKTLDLEKLERVIRYAQTRNCRQLEILDYFGDPQRKACQTCDNCKPGQHITVEQPPSKLAGDDAIVEAVRITLSGAARAKERIGKELLAMMLARSASSRISKLGLDKLTTYGLLSDLRQSDVSELIDAMIESRLLAYVDLDRFRAVLTLTELGKLVMRGKESLPTRFNLSNALAARLRSRRRTRIEQPAPPALPSAAPEQAADLTRDIQPPQVSRPASVPARIPESPVEPTVTIQPEYPTYYWTWRLMADGYSLEACAAIRSLDEMNLLGHLVQAAQQGLAVDMNWLLTIEQQKALAGLISSPSAERHREDPAHLPFGIRREHLQLFQELERADRESE